MTLITNNSNNLTTIKPSKMQPTIVSHRVVLGITAFSISFGLSLVPNWDISKAFFTGIITVLATYAAAFLVDKRRRSDELRMIGSLQRRIRDIEGLKSRILKEIHQLEEYRNLLYTETQQLENQIGDCRSQRDGLHRDIGTLAAQKKQIETELNNLQDEFKNLDNSNIELNNICNNLIVEKRRLELNCNASRAELNQIQPQLETTKQQKKSLENDVILLERLKPQLEEKLYELRIEVQNQELEIARQNDLLLQTNTAINSLENTVNALQNRTIEQKSETNELQNQISFLQNERDLLQNQVWELLQQIETINPQILPDNEENDLELFPFDELLEPLDNQDYYTDNLPKEWDDFLKHLPIDKIQVLQAILEGDNPKATIKQIAEANITTPNLLINAINDIASNTIGKLIIKTNTEIPEIIEEHLLNVKIMITKYSEIS
ncbi:MAG: tellurite resistance TerB C-terminal domain-containing protein [Aphanizomenon sp.]